MNFTFKQVFLQSGVSPQPFASFLMVLVSPPGCLYVYLFYLFVCLRTFLGLSVGLSIYLCQPICLCLSVCLSFVRPLILLSGLSACLFVCVGRPQQNTHTWVGYVGCTSNYIGFTSNYIGFMSNYVGSTSNYVNVRRALKCFTSI